MDVRPYLLLGSTALAQVQAVVAAAAGGWATDWGVEVSNIVCYRACEGDRLTGSTSELWTADRGSIWRGSEGDLLRQLQQAMFAGDRTYGPAETASVLAAEAASAARDQLHDAVSTALLGEAASASPAVPPGALWRPASGAMVVDVRVGSATARWLLSPELVSVLVQRPQAEHLTALPAVALHQVLARQPVRLTVEAGKVTVTLASVLSLAPGDVVRLDTTTTDPLTVRGPDGSPMLTGYLGTQAQHLALDVAAGAFTSKEQT